MNEPGYERVERNVDRKRTLHAFGCVVDGGTARHGRRRFHCPRCDELADGDPITHLREQAEKYARTWA